MGLANNQSNVILLVLPGLQPEISECEFWKKVPNPNFCHGSHPIFSKILFSNNWYYASLESAKLGLSRWAIKCYFEELRQPELTYNYFSA